MAEKNSFSITKVELRKLLINYGISENTIARFFGDLEKSHRHINAIAFISLMEKSGVSNSDIINVLRRLGMDDVVISRLMNDEDESKLSVEPGRIFEATIDFSGESSNEKS
jgi:hypothetical protein